MRLVHIAKDSKEQELTALVQRYTWTGHYQEAARKLELELAVSATDSSLPAVFIDLADMLMLFDDEGVELFRGYVFTKSKTLTGSTLSLTAYDGMIYLIKSQLSKLFTNVTAEQVARAICSELAVEAGSMAVTAFPQSFPHLARTGYEAIMTAYTTASKHNGKLYMPRMNAGKLDVIEKGATVARRLVLTDRHVVESTYSEDIEAMVNTVLITDEKGNRFGSVSNPQWAVLYGKLQQVYQKEEGKDTATMAKALLQDLNRQASMELVGGTDAYDLIAGNAVQIREEYTGLTGLFYIDSDTHTFENGQHMVSLELNFRNVMDEQQADKLDQPKSSAEEDIFLELNEY
ncbi:MAG: hypothetical protein K0R57_2091 [Paenibacillaceae bacterium]|jgi:hypothetical protein|nr:hypothetical protein [Paenibacillaceae bacterium]